MFPDFVNMAINLSYLSRSSKQRFHLKFLQCFNVEWEQHHFIRIWIQIWKDSNLNLVVLLHTWFSQSHTLSHYQVGFDRWTESQTWTEIQNTRGRQRVHCGLSKSWGLVLNPDPNFDETHFKEIWLFWWDLTIEKSSLLPERPFSCPLLSCFLSLSLSLSLSRVRSHALSLFLSTLSIYHIYDYSINIKVTGFNKSRALFLETQRNFRHIQQYINLASIVQLFDPQSC